MFVAVGIGYVGGRRRSAAGERPSRHAEAHGASPSPVARIPVRSKARNAHHAYSGRAPAQSSSFKRRARHSNRIFPNHQARCALLIPLRFEFANEFRSRRPNDGPFAVAPTRVPIRRTAAPPSAAFRPRGVTPNRGNNVASPLRRTRAPYPCEELATESRRLAGAHCERRGPNRSRNAIAFGERPNRRALSTQITKSNGHRHAPVIRNRHVVMGDCQKRPGGPNAQALEPPSLLGSDFARRTCCKPSRPVLVASPPYRRVTHRVEGGSQPKGPG